MAINFEILKTPPRYNNSKFTGFYNSTVSDDPGRLKRHRGLTDDFAKLFVDITKEGLFEPSYGSILWRMWECCFFWAMAVLLINSSSFPLQLLGCGCFAMGSGRGGWLMHEGGHHSLTGKLCISNKN